MNTEVCVFVGEALKGYNFGEEHPFGPRRLQAFLDEFYGRHLQQRVTERDSAVASQDEIERFHSTDYVEQVRALSALGQGYFDQGDTPVFPGAYEAAAIVVGTVLAALRAIMNGNCRRAFVPIAGLHHARRDGAAGFCIFNDCGVAIESLRQEHGIQRIAYVDIDAHHGDGVFYAFEADPDLCVVDLHEDGRFLYPGSGAISETGRGPAAGTKLNVPMPPGATDELFFTAWETVEAFVWKARPEFILLQCGADSLSGDPITHLNYSAACHRHAAERLSAIADEQCAGRLLALGGGGYNLPNLARAWCAVVEALAGSQTIL
jgi:acetoin utilization protein AcuC